MTTETCFASILFAHLVNDPAGDPHAVENGHVDDGGHSTVVDGLRAVRPHIRTLRQVDVARRKAARPKHMFTYMQL